MAAQGAACFYAAVRPHTSSAPKRLAAAAHFDTQARQRHRHAPHTNRPRFTQPPRPPAWAQRGRAPRTRRTVCAESAAAAAASSSANVVTVGRTPRPSMAAYTRSAWSSRPPLPHALSAVLNVTAGPARHNGSASMWMLQAPCQTHWRPGANEQRPRGGGRARRGGCGAGTAEHAGTARHGAQLGTLARQCTALSHAFVHFNATIMTCPLQEDPTRAGAPLNCRCFKARACSVSCMRQHHRLGHCSSF